MAETPPERLHDSDPWEKSARLERENEELAKGILELQHKLTVAEQTHFLYRNAMDRRLSAADKRTKYAEDRLQGAVNLGETFYRRERRKETDLMLLRSRLRRTEEAMGEYTLPVQPFPAGEEPEARWGLTELGRAAMRGGLLFREKKIREAMEDRPAPLEGFQGSIIAKAWERDGARYDLAAVCARCGRPYREHIEPAGPECDGFMAEESVDGKEAGLRFRCGACMLILPLVDRAPSTMPLCNQCWRKDP